MYICVRCRLEMRCDKNGVGADFGNGHVYASDRWRCPQCGTMILATRRKAYYERPEERGRVQDEYLEMTVSDAIPTVLAG